MFLILLARCQSISIAFITRGQQTENSTFIPVFTFVLLRNDSAAVAAALIFP